ncbi:type IV pilus modification protein PilV [uncultured Thiodictyon sp.]|uniref:type IV pilus modification protein PilV n=1 Tax=uncultured Thiodictyon sp. TaxID=1846217 RepID=UPI0025CEE94B|nr:type IV pilus modification protein PilV [uncultured Thiodictyon sp.]
MSVTISNALWHRLVARRWPRTARLLGFDLIEVLLTLVLFAIGLLGLAGLQVRSLSDSHASVYRTIASQQAYDIADRIAANLAGVTAGYYDNLTATIPSNPNCISSSCTPANMALTDQYQWLTANSVVLPGGTGTVRCVSGPAPTCVINTPGANRVFDVTVSWSERAAGAPVTQDFVTRFAP